MCNFAEHAWIQLTWLIWNRNLDKRQWRYVDKWQTEVPLTVRLRSP